LWPAPGRRRSSRTTGVRCGTCYATMVPHRATGVYHWCERSRHLAIRDRYTAHMKDGKKFEVVATVQGGSVGIREPEGRDPFISLIEFNSVADRIRTLRVARDEVQALVQDRAPAKKK